MIFHRFDKKCGDWYAEGMLSRAYDQLESFLCPQKVLVLYGPRRVGKTTLIQLLLEKTTCRYLSLSGDNMRVQHILSSREFSSILGLVEGYELVVIDEAQQIPDIGMALKIMIDQRPELKIVATGSSSFDLAQKIGEPLTGRKTTLTLYPMSQAELYQHKNRSELRATLPEWLVYGLYPEVVTTERISMKQQLIMELVQSYLLKDILTLDRIRSSKTLFQLLQLLAFQIGNEVSYSELGNQLGMDVKTVQRYLDLLEKSFVIISVGALSRNMRNEVKRKNKYYFWDNGIRNGVISQFNEVSSRDDVGQLWENFVMIERIKKRNYQQIYANSYFWRNYQQQEIDIIEERDGTLSAYECKWNPFKKVKVPSEWLAHYPKADFNVITPENYLDFVL